MAKKCLNAGFASAWLRGGTFLIMVFDMLHNYIIYDYTAAVEFLSNDYKNNRFYYFLFL